MVNRNSDDEKPLRLVKGSVFGFTTKLLLETHLISNVISADTCAQLHIQTRNTSGQTRMANGTEIMVLGEVSVVPITVGGITRNLTFLVMKDVLIDLIIRILAMTTKWATIDFNKETASFRSGTKEVPVPPWVDKKEGVKS